MTAHPASPSAPACPAPLPVSARPALALPRGACDTHAHVVGDRRFPMVEARSYTPPPASTADYLAMLDAFGFDRGVLVQISVYGTDNSCMMEALRAHPERLRGVAVVAPDVGDAELVRLHEAGVRGVRINALFGGGVDLADLSRLAERVCGLGWHVQLLMDVRDLVELAPVVERLPVDVVFDHMGHLPTAEGLGHPGFRRLLDLMANGRTWAKLSGAYRLSPGPSPFGDTTPFARALLDAAPDRCVWGSDWPHVAVPGPMFETVDLVELLATWVPDEGLRERVLVHNPARLYGFPAPPGKD